MHRKYMRKLLKRNDLGLNLKREDAMRNSAPRG